MGAGQLINGEWIKGLVMAFYHTFILLYVGPILRQTWWGLFTLGEVPRRDHSIILLSYGLVGALITIIVLGVYLANIVDAYRQGKKRARGLPPLSL